MAEPRLEALRFQVGRYSENELVLFDETRQESWIVYPPRSAYDFLHLRRTSKTLTLVEHHPWAPFSAIEDHQVDARQACTLHGVSCDANTALRAAVELGFNPFA
jgi:hypothetical protein